MTESLIKNRAWVEIDLDNLEHNIDEIKKIISKKTKIMAVLKANAYGHDLIIISKKLNEIGIEDFAVATLDEGIILRKNNIKGNILIMGFTSIENIQYVIDYDLIQTVIDEEYANELIKLHNSKELKVHLKINTGMNRIGISYNNFEFVKNLYNEKKLNILGIYSHLCTSNSNKKRDIAFANEQISRFNNLINYLKDSNINVGKVHIQSSYGILNFPELEYDYVRAGIIIYGLYNDNNTYAKIHLNIKPVLTLKSKIVSIKELKKGETVGYGRTYKAIRNEKMAAVSIGYVDGYPKNLSELNAYVKVNNHYAKVIGRICMDQLVINITNIPNVKVNDIVTLIGNSKYINAENLATKLKTITPELLGRLGSRLNYIPVRKNNLKS